MWNRLQNNAVKLVIAFFLLFIGSTFSIAGILNNTDNNDPIVLFVSSQILDSCQILSDSNQQCAESSNHSDSSTNTNHCQNHCSHCISWMLSKQNRISPNLVMRKTVVTSAKPYQNVALDPGFRPPNL